MTLKQLKVKYLREGAKIGYKRALQENFVGGDDSDAALYRKILKSLVAVFRDDKEFAYEEGIDLDLLTIADKWQMNDYADKYGIDRTELIDRYDPLIQALEDFALKYGLDLDDIDQAMEIMQEY